MAGPEFLERAKNPQDYPFIQNDDGSVSTHLMSAEIDEDGRIYAFPTIVPKPNGELMKFDDRWKALDYNKKIGNLMEFDTIEEAVEFSKGGDWKVPLERFKPGEGEY